jgi:hypothetical protein
MPQILRLTNLSSGLVVAKRSQYLEHDVKRLIHLVA